MKETLRLMLFDEYSKLTLDEIVYEIQHSKDIIMRYHNLNVTESELLESQYYVRAKLSLEILQEMEQELINEKINNILYDKRTTIKDNKENRLIRLFKRVFSNV